jgi:hypothetical protein
METVVFGCRVERNSISFLGRDSGALLRRTAEGGSPHVVLASR